MNDNPAGRLSELLERGQSMPGNEKVFAVWAQLLDVGTDDMGLLMSEIALVVDLPRQIRIEVAKLPGDTAIYLENLPNIENQLYFLPLQHEWAGMVRDITAEARYGLKICAERLSRERPEPVLNDDQLAEIERVVRELFDYIADGDLDEPLRTFVLTHLEAIGVALRRVRICGVGPLNDELLRVIGDFVVNLDVRERVNTEDPKAGRVSDFMHHVFGWIVAIQAAATGVEKTATAIEAVKHTMKALTAGN